MKKLISLLFMVISMNTSGQSYTSYYTGNVVDTNMVPSGGICMMGGATENDEAMKWFLRRANGGDVLVLRTSGADGYNNYMYAALGIQVNSVETIVFNDSSASSDNYVLQKIMKAEAIWFAGGDQWTYISYWRGTQVDSLVNDAIKNRNIVIGGTSAGMAIQGGFYFSAQNGTVTSANALADPYNNYMTIDSIHFMKNNYLNDVITDTHYDNPDRKGRHIAFLARINQDYGVAAKGIACDEYTAVCIDTNGIAGVYGDYPANDDYAYFIQTNCELTSIIPEQCAPGQALNWNLERKAIRVYHVEGTNAGTNNFDLKDWKTGNGGVWENWFVDNGTFNDTTGTQINCIPLSIDLSAVADNFRISPNPCRDVVIVKSGSINIDEISILDINGKILKFNNEINNSEVVIEVNELASGLYFLRIGSKNRAFYFKLLIN